MRKKVAWFSCGASSFLAAYLSKPDEIIYIHIDDQHEDSLRYLHDCEKLLGKEIKILQSFQYTSVDDVVRKTKYINGVAGAMCTNVLKKRVRKLWEKQNKGINLTYVWGFDLDEKHRAERLIYSMTAFKHEFPLIDSSLTKKDIHGICERLGLKRPAMYDMGYSNNNCIGCVKGGMGYWNKIRVDFPEAFKLRAESERFIGASCINGIYLDELDPSAGRMEKEIMEECGIFCQLQF